MRHIHVSVRELNSDRLQYHRAFVSILRFDLHIDVDIRLMGYYISR